MNLTDFKSALNSLNPTTMYTKNTHIQNSRDWNLGSSIFPSMPYYQCVFSAAGFCEAVYYLVNEYNAKERNKMYIYHLDKVRKEFNQFYQQLRSNISEIKSQPDISITQDQWNSKSQTAKNKPTLQQYCKERSIKYSGDTKKQLIQKLDQFDLQEVLQTLKL